MKKLNAKSLMVGDWVYNFKGEICKVCALSGIFDSNITLDNYSKSNDGTFETEFEVSPIPLTREILEKNGFEEFDGWMLYEFEANEISWCGTILKGCGELGNYEFPDIQYVHQLQHLLKAVGCDKEIVI